LIEIDLLQFVKVFTAFSALTLLVGQQEGHPACKTQWWSAGVVICLERGADLHMAQLMPLPLTAACFSEIQMVLPFWCRLTQVVLDKGPLKWCMLLPNQHIRLPVYSTHMHSFNNNFSREPLILG